MDILLISTTDMKAGREVVRNRMLQSLVESERTLGNHRMVLALLMQNCLPEELSEIADSMPPFVHPITISNRIPLSTARNLLLRAIRAERHFGVNALVAFPDDDCWYPPGLLATISSLFARDESLDLWFCRYGSRPLAATTYTYTSGTPRTRELVRNASSNTLFLRGCVAATVEFFDEELGVGTALGGGEDLDYALRARRVARKVVYTDAALVGHRDKSSEFRARYYASGLVVLARHARYGTWMAFIRKVAVGIYLTMRGEITNTALVAALRRALLEFRSPKCSAPGN